jgi:hypothetical protein
MLVNPSEKILYEVVTYPLISLEQVPKRAEPLCPGLASHNSRYVSCLSTLPVSLLTISFLAVVEFPIAHWLQLLFRTARYGEKRRHAPEISEGSIWHALLLHCRPC